ncbi:DoxX-like family protein [Sphingobacterium mizutaii]|uniref:DoxX-like family protein n=1 Tax=Sphingobacterium mizutaii TaxID=1010 RepID=UPI0028ACEC8B|nr:DoxX-like family protein [Sphingobacterium mizutaii]
MESARVLNRLLILFFSLIWLVNGLFCKILDLVPRHQQIVAEILGETYAKSLTIAIGVGEMLMAIWIISRKFAQLSAITQILLIVTMNILEFILAPHLLLWGRLNIVFALCMAALVYYQGFVLEPRLEGRSRIA